MKGLLVALLALTASIFLALFLKEDAGYILISYGKWTVEATLALFLALNIGVFIALYLVLRSLFRIRNVPTSVHNWRAKKTISKAQQTLTQGLVELAEGSWQQAEKSLLKHVHESKTPLINYLAAARAAQLQGSDERRDQHLQLAHESMPTADLAVGLTQAELQLSHNQHEQALATLNHLHALSPKHTYVLKLLANLYETQGEWSNLQQLLPLLKKRKLEEPEALKQLEIKTHIEMMRTIGLSDGNAALTNYWRKLSGALRGNTKLMEVYGRSLLEAGDTETASVIFAALLPKAWSPELVLLYGNIETRDSAKQLTSAEGWLTTHQKDANLLLTLARLSMRNKLWGKARSYLEASINIEPQPATYNELGALLEQMDEPDMAMSCYRSGLAMVTNKSINIESVAELPKPEESEELPALASS